MRPHLASLVDEFRQHASETAVVSHRGNRRYHTTYGELAHLAGRFAAELDRLHLAPGDRVVLWGDNSADWIAAFFGCLLRGVIVVPLDSAGSPEFADRVIRDVRPHLIVGDRHLLASLSTDAPQLPLSNLAAQLPPQPSFTLSPSVTDQTPFQIIFTSGTTSEPKGIVHTHRNVLASLQPIEDEIAKYRKYERIFHPLRFLHTLPLSHVFGQFMGLWIPAILAAELHLSDQLEPARITGLIHRERVSVLIAVPRVLQLLQTHLLRQFPSLASDLELFQTLPIAKRWWRFRRVHRALGWKFWAIISGGATLPSELESFWNRLGFALIQGYGLTETAALVTLNHPFHISRGTIGKPLPGREVRISDDGEILVRGDMLAQSAWHNGAMHPRTADWLSTGDLAATEDSGQLRFLGRKGDLIVTPAGMNIHPADLEAAMLQQPGVRACVVVGCNTPAGTEPVAVVLFSPTDQSRTDPSQTDPALQLAVTNANLRLAEYQRIRRVLHWPAAQLPYTSTGKLLRRQVKDWASTTLAAQQQSGSSTPHHDILLTLIAEITGETLPLDPYPDHTAPDHLRLSEDLHLDSLGRVQLQSSIEQQLGLDLPDDAISNTQTLGDLRTLLTSISTAAPTPTPHPPAANPTLPPHQTQTQAQTQTQIPTEAPPHPSPTPPSNRQPTETPDIYPHWSWTWPIRALRIAFIELILRPLVWALAAPTVKRPPEPPPPGPLLVIANHVTAYDAALILYALPWRLRRRTAIAMSGEMLRDLRRGRNQSNPLLNFLAPLAYWLVTALFNVYPLPRLHGFRRSFDHAGHALDRGYAVLVFPEGSRTGNLQPFRPGIGLLAQQSRVPVLPVAVIGLGELRATHANWLRSGRIEIRIAQPIPFDETQQPPTLTSEFHRAIEHLLS